jgi:hypothetical protein
MMMYTKHSLEELKDCSGVLTCGDFLVYVTGYEYEPDRPRSWGDRYF